MNRKEIDEKIIMMLNDTNDKMKKFLSTVSISSKIEETKANEYSELMKNLIREIRSFEHMFLQLNDRRAVYFAGKVMGRIEGSNYILMKAVNKEKIDGGNIL